MYVCMYMFCVWSVFLEKCSFPINECPLSSKGGKAGEGIVRCCFIGMCVCVCFVCISDRGTLKVFSSTSTDGCQRWKRGRGR